MAAVLPRVSETFRMRRVIGTLGSTAKSFGLAHPPTVYNLTPVKGPQTGQPEVLRSPGPHHHYVLPKFQPDSRRLCPPP